MTSIYTYGGLVAAVAIVAVVGVYASRQNTASKLAFAPHITAVQSGAFGSLVSQDGKDVALQGAAQSDQAAASRMVAGYGGGGGGAEFYPGPQDYKYTYVGDALNLSDAEVGVLRRITGTSAASAVSEYLGTLDFGVFSVGSFGSTEVQNMSFSEDKDFGYVVNIGFLDGSISINENWQRWPHPGEECRDQACSDKYKLSESDIPQDGKLIRIAHSFLSDHGIGTDVYGEPFVDKTWRVYYDQGEATELYIPDMLQVKYPLMVNGEAVYEQGGDVAGLIVNVNIRFSRVVGLSGLFSQQYESSAYTAETDADYIIKIAESGGLYGYLVPARNALEIKLGTPERILMRQWNYQSGVSQELLVPALSFPVVSAPKEVPYYQKRPIIIPLAQELLVRDNSGGPILLDQPVAEETLPAESVEPATDANTEESLVE
ncbi:hypothetical protein BK004_02175 [bacterium CG10_46_32]|nr:MAG: hypothetical protein BK004_02175 [bacterium CG10_46_32]PIP67450.1 MAG: hypothetical protein COW93_00070 [Parcubacteria group bacterium CG22_combo_CG10-13_8_21_14_all_41_9]PIR56237.1 MAG: hypothetical protein COU73_02200 [Parcubacteria group bacterium CG10_big_fil_rev_8_21_14_0_10_46_32]